MKAIRISAIWCPSCLIERPIYDEVLDEFNIDNIELDLDIDEEEVQQLSVGSILPVLIIYRDDKEVLRVVGEKTKEELINLIKEV